MTVSITNLKTLIPTDSILDRLKRQEKKVEESSKSFHDYARQVNNLFYKEWWSDYLLARAIHSERIVKIYGIEYLFFSK